MVMYAYDLQSQTKNNSLPQRLQVLHWGTLDYEVQTHITERKIGESYELFLEAAQEHEQLRQEQINSSNEDLLLPRFYDVQRYP